jgi:hypothetical protein
VHLSPLLESSPRCYRAEKDIGLILNKGSWWVLLAVSDV